MDTKTLENIIELFEKSSISTLELESDGMKIKLGKNPIVINSTSASSQTAQITQSNQEIKTEIETNCDYVESPLVGTFHAAPAPNAVPFVNKGDKVSKGQKLCIIEAMKVMNEVYATCDGVIKDILVKEGQMVEYGQKLFAIGEENV